MLRVGLVQERNEWAASTSTPCTGLLSNDGGELLTCCARGVAHAEAHDSDDVEPGIIGTASGLVAALTRLVPGERFANDVGARQPPALGAEIALSLRVTPRMAAAPATVSITVTVEPNERNRVLVIEDDSDVYYRSSRVQLEGKNAARTHLLLLRGLPPGEHRVRASVHGTNGFIEVVTTTVIVAGDRGVK